jgi:DNA-binding beta-propeller fold protein YncE
VIFDPADTVHRWPTPPDEPRIAYIGQLRSDADLKPGRRGLQGLSETLFGKEAPHAILKPMGVCTDGGSRVFVADCDAGVVHVFDLNTRKYQQWKPPKGERRFLEPVALAYDAPSGRLLVADSLDGSIVVFDSAGKYRGTMGDNWLHRPCGLAVDRARDRLLVVDSAAHQIIVLGLDGQRRERVGKRGTEPGEFNYPTNVALDSEGRIYVSDSLNFRVQVFDADFKPLRQMGRKGDLPGYFSQPKGLAIDRDDHLYVVDANFEAVQVFDKDGALLMAFGKEGHGPGEFWLPVGIGFDPGAGGRRIWVADSFNRRVQAFESLPDQGGGDAKAK